MAAVSSLSIGLGDEFAKMLAAPARRNHSLQTCRQCHGLGPLARMNGHSDGVRDSAEGGAIPVVYDVTSQNRYLRRYLRRSKRHKAAGAALLQVVTSRATSRAHLFTFCGHLGERKSSAIAAARRAQKLRAERALTFLKFLLGLRLQNRFALPKIKHDSIGDTYWLAIKPTAVDVEEASSVKTTTKTIIFNWLAQTTRIKGHTVYLGKSSELRSRWGATSGHNSGPAGRDSTQRPSDRVPAGSYLDEPEVVSVEPSIPSQPQDEHKDRTSGLGIDVHGTGSRLNRGSPTQSGPSEACDHSEGLFEHSAAERVAGLAANPRALVSEPRSSGAVEESPRPRQRHSEFVIDRLLQGAVWSLPTEGTREALRLVFPEVAKTEWLQSALSVWSADGDQLQGETRIPLGSHRWEFRPADAWQSEPYWLVMNHDPSDTGSRDGLQPLSDSVLSNPSLSLPARPIELPFRPLDAIRKDDDSC